METNKTPISLWQNLFQLFSTSIIIVIYILFSSNWTLNNEPNNGSHFLVVEFFYICCSLVQQGSMVHALHRHVTRHLLLMGDILVCLYHFARNSIANNLSSFFYIVRLLYSHFFMVGHSNFFLDFSNTLVMGSNNDENMNNLVQGWTEQNFFMETIEKKFSSH